MELRCAVSLPSWTSCQTRKAAVVVKGTTAVRYMPKAAAIYYWNVYHSCKRRSTSAKKWRLRRVLHISRLAVLPNMNVLSHILEVVKRWLLDPPFLGDGDTPDFGQTFSNSTHFWACGRL